MATAIADYARTPEVDLWGSLFTVNQVTKTTEGKIDEKLEAISERARKLDLEVHDNQIKIFAERMDVWLSPAAGGKKKASTILHEKWEAGDLTVAQFVSFWEGVQEEINRPT